MIAIFFTCLNLIIPIVHAQEYNPASDVYDSLINVFVPLLIISAYNTSPELKVIVGIFEFIIGAFLAFCFPPVYNFFIYNSTSKYDRVCMISGVIFTFLAFIFVICEKIFVNEFDATFEGIANSIKQIKSKSLIIISYIFFALSIFTYLPTLSFALAIYWIKKDDISEKIGYSW